MTKRRNDDCMDIKRISGVKERTKRTRVPTTRKKMKTKGANILMEKYIEFDDDEFGCPFGIWQSTFTSYVGAVTQMLVDINIESWNKVSQCLKNTIWRYVKKEFNIKDDERKNSTLDFAAFKWEGFKTWLVNRYLMRNEDPFEAYDFLTVEQWEKFKKTHEIEEPMAGYAGKRTKRVVKDPLCSLASLEATNSSMLSDDRCVRRRVKEKEAGVSYIPNEKSREVSQNSELQRQVSQWTWPVYRHKHLGRIGRAGGGTCVTNDFGKSTRYEDPSKLISVEEFRAFKEETLRRIDDMVSSMVKSTVKDLLNRVGIQMPTDVEVDMKPPHIRSTRSSCQSVDLDPFSKLQVNFGISILTRSFESQRTMNACV